jgi:DNA-binding transcriptional MerR regulator
VRIGELAELAGVSTRTVRHYHGVGVLPEPGRDGNGYRAYELRDLVMLLRARRLVELGLSLDEVGAALADDQGGDLAEMLAELDGDLAARQGRIQDQRDRIARLVDSGAALPSADLAGVLEELTRAAGPDHPGLAREKLIAELAESAAGDHTTFPDAYRRVLADDDLRERMLGAQRRFEDLADLPPGDPAVQALADETRGFGDAVRALLPPEITESAGDPEAAERLLRAAGAGMSPAQARCLRLMFANWRQETP